MRKILIFGNSGSGKSTLARRLYETEGLRHLDLDVLAWNATEPPTRAALGPAKQMICEFQDASGGWVIEGCYADLLELAKPGANEMIFLDLPVEQCVANAKNRPWEPHKYESQEAQDRNLSMLIEWISGYTERQDELSHKAHLALYNSFEGPKTLLTDNPMGTVKGPRSDI